VIVPASPVFLALAVLYTRRADTLDEDFRELVRRR
jgi:hypothetical protein